MILWDDCAQGINADAMPSELGDGVWSDGRNVRFRGGFASRVKGIAQVFSSTSVVPYFLLPYQTATKKYWIHAGLAAIYADDGTTRTDITGTTPTGTAANKWTGGVIGGVPFLNNEANVPQYWTGNTADNFASLPGWNANHRAKFVRAFGNQLIAGNITESSTNYPHIVRMSHVADPGSIPDNWDLTDATKDTIEIPILETPDLIVDGLALGDSFIVYKERSMYELRKTNDSRIAAMRRLPGETGILAVDCVADTPVGHVVLASGDVVVHQGQGTRSILDGKLRQWLFSQIDSTYYYRSFVVANPKYSEVWICFPTAGNSSCNMAIMWNWREDRLGIRTLPNLLHGASGQISVTTEAYIDDVDTMIDDTVGFIDENEFAPNEGRLLVCKDSKIGIADSTGQDFGTDIEAYLERTGIHFGAPERMKLLKGLYPRLMGSAGFTTTVKLGASMTSDNAPSYSTGATFTMGQSQKIDSFANGRFVAIRIESNGSQPWRLRGLGFDVKQGGFF